MSATDESYRALEAAMKAARVPGALWEGIGDVWVDDPARAHHLITRFKDNGQAPISANDPLEAAYIALRQAFDAGDAAAVQAALQQLTTAVMPRSVGATTKLGDDGKPVTTKAQRADAFWDGLSASIQRTGGNQL